MDTERLMIDLAKVFLKRGEAWMLDDAGYSVNTKLRAFAELQQEHENEIERDKAYADCRG